ncbi:MAG: DoxX family protein [Candidatus Dormibacteraeota bacterium]|nr:DoxX family protein [Candidatus Dormibacteraeota bacterium]MBO0745543.1 DoxX family protein [Candidatus Dormibacteraeota bacterium]
MAQTVATAGTRRRSGRVLKTVGWVLTVLVGLFMAFDVVEHASGIPAVVQSFHQLGFPVGVALPLSIVEACCLVLYLVPRTKVLGAILLTGYLGGAVALKVRIEAPLLSDTLFPVYTATVMWLAVYLRDSRLRAVLPPLAR